MGIICFLCLVIALSCNAEPLPAVHTSAAACPFVETISESCNGELGEIYKRMHSFKHNRRISSVFSRWGSSSCTNQSELVYSGVMAGAYNYHQGAPTSHHCLVMEPEFANVTLPDNYGLLDGYNDVPCSVCKAYYSSTIMIPAIVACPNGWTTQYIGYLMGSSLTAGQGKEYICVDQVLELGNGTEKSTNSDWLVHVAARCGSLPCPPYIDKAIIQCVVCSI